ncbi:MAG: Actinobacteria/chloroflexi release factor, partial [Actinomycetota bacterium]|nr:Actinobacteria/chloroflexi release factor [Actinomycetota bacterium]
VLADPRLQHLSAVTEPRILDVPDPKLAVLTATPALYRAVRIRIIDPDPPA